MPTAEKSRPQRPGEAGPGNARRDVRIINDVGAIVEIDEGVTGQIAVTGPGADYEDQAEQQRGLIFPGVHWGGVDAGGAEPSCCLRSSICFWIACGAGESVLAT